MNNYAIRRSIWLRGEGPKRSVLYRPCDDKMCVLGQIANQCGYSKSELAHKKSLRSLIDLKGSKGVLPLNLFSLIMCEISALNDDASISEERREYNLKERFKMFGVKLFIVD